MGEALGPGSGRAVRVVWAGSEVGGKARSCGRGLGPGRPGRLCGPRGPRGWGQPPVGLRVWLCDPGASWRLSLQTHWAGAHCLWAGLRGGRGGCALPRLVGGSPHEAPGARTLHFWILHEREEGVAQRGAHGLGASKEQTVCGHQQSIHVEVAQRALLLLRGIRGGDVSQGRGGDPAGSDPVRPAPHRPAQLLLRATSVPPLFNFLSLGELGSAEGQGRENLSRGAHNNKSLRIS